MDQADQDQVGACAECVNQGTLGKVLDHLGTHVNREYAEVEAASWTQIRQSVEDATYLLGLLQPHEEQGGGAAGVYSPAGIRGP